MDGVEDLDLPLSPERALPLQNSYAVRKTVAQGLMDVALLMANANEIRFLVDYASESKSFYFVMALVSASIVLQVVVGVSLIFKGRCDLSGDSKLQQANRINNFTLAAVFLITVLNIFITAFTSTPNAQQAVPLMTPAPQTP